MYSTTYPFKLCIHFQHLLMLGVLAVMVTLLQPVANGFELIQSQVGYHTQSAKVLYLQDWVDSKPPVVSFYDPLAPKAWFGLSGKTLLKQPAVQVQSSLPNHTDGPSHPLWKVDFTSLKKSGEYDIRINGKKTDAHVTLSDFVFWDGLTPIMQSFYLLRSGMKVSSRALDVDRPSAHVNDGYWTDIKDGKTYRKDVTGGWYTGSMTYEKDTSTTAAALAYLLSAYLDDPTSFKTLNMAYPISEYSHTELQESLNEMKVGLDWLMTMQHRDGWFAEKVDGRQAIPWKTRPHEDVQTRYVTGHVRSDDALVASVLAMASRAYHQQDVGYSVKCMLSARRAWASFQHSIKQQPLTSVELPAAALAEMELFLTTGEEGFLTELPDQLAHIQLNRLNPDMPAVLGVYHMLSSSKEGSQRLSPAFRRTLENMMMPLGPTALGSLKNRLTHYPLEHPGVYQAVGANKNLLSRMALILMSDQLSMVMNNSETSSIDSLQPVAEGLYYLLGVNRYQTSFITGVGTQWPHHPAHLLSSGYKHPVPGMIVAGPYLHLGMHSGKTRWADGIRRKSGVVYLDDERDERGNQTDVVTNALGVFVMSELNHLLNVEVEDDSASSYVDSFLR